MSTGASIVLGAGAAVVLLLAFALAAFFTFKVRRSTFGRTLCLLAVCAVIGLFYPVVLAAISVPSAEERSSDPVTITGYNADFVVDPAGDLSATETISVDVPTDEERHGIFRFWDLSDQSDPAVRYEVRDVDVTMDGGPVPVELRHDDSGRYLEARIGDPDSLISGSHTYRITYAVDGVLALPGAGADDSIPTVASGSGEKPTSVFYWKLIPPGWAMPIDDARITLRLPEPPTGLQCAVGTPASGCTVSDAGVLTFTASGLPPYSAMSVRAGLPTVEPSQAYAPWSRIWDDVFGPSVLFRNAMLLLALAAGLLGLQVSRTVSEHAPGTPLMYQPPGGLGPVQTAYAVTETTGECPIAASLVHAAELGLLRLQSADSWRVVGVAAPRQWESADPVTREVGAALGVQTRGAAFDADGRVSAGEKLTEAQEGLDRAVEQWCDSGGLFRASAADKLLVGTWVLAVVAAAGLLLVGPTFAALPFTVYAIAGLGVFHPGWGYRRTPDGRRVWSAAAGFRRVLATDSAQDRAAFAALHGKFLRYLPYAMSFGVAQQWEAQMRSMDAREVDATPVWYVCGIGGSGNSHDASPGSRFAVDELMSFDSAVAASIKSYEAKLAQDEARASSSSSGGSSSGGGGGGGGGSW